MRIVFRETTELWNSDMIDATGISTSSGISVTWGEIVAVSAHKIDAKTKVVTYLVFDHECGECLEIMDGEPEFQSVIESLDHFLDLPDGWRTQLEAATADDEILELWRRPKA